MEKYSDKWKDDTEKCGNGDKESDIEVEGEETRSMEALLVARNDNPSVPYRTYDILGLAISAPQT